MSDWKIFQGSGNPHNGISKLPKPPSWRQADRRKQNRGETFQARPEEIELVNAALYLRRPLLVTGKPGTGKSSLAYAVARELKLGEVLYWPITTRTTLKDGLYVYDAIARLQDARQRKEPGEGGEQTKKEEFANIGNYIRLGPLGTALLESDKPRVLLVDEIDKSDIDLPNDLLYVFEEGEFEIPELVRLEKIIDKVTVRTAYKDENEPLTYRDREATIAKGRVRCSEFPFVILTSNGERDFPPPFLRRCIRMTMQEPEEDRLRLIVEAHLGSDMVKRSQALIDRFLKRFLEKRQDRTKGDLATDQLLNALYLVTQEGAPTDNDRDRLVNRLWKHLSSLEDLKSDSSPNDSSERD
ncbi:AAA family ATPase [Baaleninema simplex]|uniref:AAA family ATPase n=1 Tax=Baaleninema simplex TaxID=2862350 RepID=UPI00034B59F5|nr:MoxR family ATPase [Baaleninema simplex]